MKKFKKILGIALAMSLVITQFPGKGKTAKAAMTTGVNLYYGQTATIVDEHTAGKTITNPEVSLKCNINATNTDGTSSRVSFNPYSNITFTVTIDGVAQEITVDGTDDTYYAESLDFTLDGITIQAGQSYKIEAITWSYGDVNSSDWLYELSVEDDTTETKTNALYYGQTATIVDELTAGKTITNPEVSLKCNINATNTDGTSSRVSFNPYSNITFTVTIDGVAQEITVDGTDDTYYAESLNFTLDGITIQAGQNYKIEAITWSYGDVNSSDWLYELSIDVPTQSETATTSPSADPSESPSANPSASPSTSPDVSASPDVDPSGLVEVQTSAGGNPKKLVTVIPETTADTDYNKATVSVECADNVSFNEYATLHIVVTVNGKETDCNQVGIGGWDTGWTGTYDIADEFSISKGDTYKVEAYTDAWESHTDSYVFKVGVALDYDSAGKDPDAGKVYFSPWSGDPIEATVLGSSKALKSADSIKIAIQCAADTSFNPWSSIVFKVFVNGFPIETEVKGTDESYSAGSLQSCVLSNLNIKKDDYVSIVAYTRSWDSAKDYVFKVSVDGEEELFESSDVTIAPYPSIVPPVSTTPTVKPTEAPSAEPTETPTADPTDVPTTEPTETPTTDPTDAPTTEPTDIPTTEPTKAPAVQKGDKVTVSGLTYKITSTSAKTVNYLEAKNSTKKNITIPATVKVTTNGKKVTYKVTGIADNAFKDCKKLQKVTIGKDIKTIGKNAFKNCSKLKTIVIKSTDITKVDKNALKGTAKNLVIKVPAKKVSAYKKLFKNKGNDSIVIKKA